jgi:hypothetical protein
MKYQFHSFTDYLEFIIVFGYECTATINKLLVPPAHTTISHWRQDKEWSVLHMKELKKHTQRLI